VTADGTNTEPIYPKWLFYYYATHLRWVADPSFLVDITGALPCKLDAIRAYRTQFVLPEKNRKVVDWVEASATYFGSRIGTEHAEAFYSREPVGLSGLGSVVGLG
jgi:LmbE family N-acetylglucosaminyl deacetylase